LEIKFFFFKNIIDFQGNAFKIFTKLKKKIQCLEMLQSFSFLLDSWLFDWSCHLSCCIMAKQWGLLYAYNASWIQNDEEFMNVNERIHSYWFAELICFVCWLG
jgi:hypothetical protein